MANMGLDFGLEGTSSTTCKRKFRWLFKIDGISGTKLSNNTGVRALPPLRSSRPSLSFKEMEARHVVETVYYPARPEYKPVNLTLYDLSRSTHPVFAWLKGCYDPTISAGNTNWFPVTTNSFIKQATLELYDGCGKVLETWTYENVWPLNVEFGELDMGSSDIVTCDLTLRYARAYIT